MSLLLNRTSFGNIANKGNALSREDAFALFHEWVINPKLQLHMKQVAYLLQRWALEKEGLDVATAWHWEMAGLLHDADWDQWPELHCKKIIEELEQRNIDPEILHAIASHGPVHFGDIKGVKKRLKEKSFAASVSRDDIEDACKRAGIVLDDLIAFIIPRQATVS